MAFSFTKFPSVWSKRFGDQTITRAIEDLQENTLAAQQVDAWQQTPFGASSPPPPIVHKDTPWEVYGSQVASKIAVSDAGFLLKGTSDNDYLEVTGRMDRSTCAGGTSHTVEAGDIVYIDVVFTSFPTPASASIKVVGRSTGWTDYPALASFDDDDVCTQTNLYIPLAVVEDVSKSSWTSITKGGDFTLIKGCLGVYPLNEGSDITLELSTYLAKACVLNNPLSGQFIDS